MSDTASMSNDDFLTVQAAHARAAIMNLLPWADSADYIDDAVLSPVERETLKNAVGVLEAFEARVPKALEKGGSAEG